jgi:hypothetical protein
VSKAPSPRSLLAAAALSGLLLLPSPGFAQARPICFRPAPRDACRSYFAAEVTGHTPFKHDPRWITSAWTDSGTGEPRSDAIPTKELSHALVWDLGLAVNVSERWAAGLTAGYGFGEASRIARASLRTRRWVRPEIAVDVAPGVFLLQRTGPLPEEDRVGWTLAARVSLWGLGFVGARYSALPIDGSMKVDGAVRMVDPGGTEQAWSAEAGLEGPTAALATGAGLAVLLVALAIGLGGVG